MKKRDVYEIALRILGMYILLQSVYSGVSALVIIGSDWGRLGGPTAQSTPIFVAQTSSAGVYFWLGLALVVGAPRIASLLAKGEPETEQEEVRERGPQRLAFWITLLGLYFAIRSAANVLSQVILLFVRTDLPVQFYGPGFVSDALLLALSVLFIFRSEKVEDFIDRMSRRVLA